mmetsp:Transcript_35350/g.112544  ORF Transcript_35350/g.112544 Transcript_35350/m.112544 type:complete len:219 (+) Transcript_35350:744-1400(+)
MPRGRAVAAAVKAGVKMGVKMGVKAPRWGWPGVRRAAGVRRTAWQSVAATRPLPMPRRWQAVCQESVAACRGRGRFRRERGPNRKWSGRECGRRGGWRCRRRRVGEASAGRRRRRRRRPRPSSPPPRRSLPPAPRAFAERSGTRAQARVTDLPATASCGQAPHPRRRYRRGRRCRYRRGGRGSCAGGVMPFGATATARAGVVPVRRRRRANQRGATAG